MISENATESSRPVEEFLDVIDQHWVTPRELELVTDRVAEIFLGPERDSGRPIMAEIFEWGMKVRPPGHIPIRW